MKTLKKLTLLEILLILTSIIILLGIIILSISPRERSEVNRDSRRWTDVNRILNAVNKYSNDHDGTLPDCIIECDNCLNAAQAEICRTDVDSPDCANLTNLSSLIEDQKYLSQIPTDPKSASENSTGYKIVKNDSGRITVCAPNAESDTILITI